MLDIAIKLRFIRGTALGRQWRNKKQFWKHQGLTKEFKGFVAVNDVDLQVRRGTIHALIGPNGAGKTTCFNLLTKFLTPTAARILYNGSDITGEQPAADRAPRPRPLVPDLGRVPAPDACSRTCASRCSASCGTSFHFWRSETLARPLNEPRAASCSTRST